MYGIIYKVENLVNGKVYVGQTTRKFEIRKREHLYYTNKAKDFRMHLHQAIRAYGKDQFTWDILEQIETKEELNQKEIYWITFYDSTNPEKGYNYTSGGQIQGIKVTSEETRRRIGAAQKGKVVSEETRQKIRESLQGRPLSEETRRKMQFFKKGHQVSEETCKKISERAKGRPKSEEHKQKIRATLKGRSLSEETKEKMRITRRRNNLP